MATVTVSSRTRGRGTFNHLGRLARELGELGRDYAASLAQWQQAHTRQEAPLGREVYTDEQGHEHPGWLRDSVDTIELPPGDSWLVTVHADYGAYVNFGTRHQAANPFWARAVARTEALMDPMLDTRTRTMLLFATRGRPA